MGENEKLFYVTVSRQFGSGGGVIAEKAAQLMNVPCYDKNIAELTSVATGLAKDVVSLSEDKASNSFWYSNFFGGNGNLSLYDRIFIGQANVIKTLAGKGSSVFVGRCAPQILADKPNVIRVFICAPIEFRIARVSKGYEITPEEAEKVIRKNDKARAQYCKKYAGIQWGLLENYDLCLNSRIGFEKAADMIYQYTKEVVGDI